MAILKNLIVNGVTRIIGDLTASKIIKQGGVSSEFLKADGSVSTLGTAATKNTVGLFSSEQHSDFNNNQDDLITRSFMSYWNGAYNDGGASNLTYCAKGIIIGSNNIGNLSVKYAATATNADTLDGNHASAFATAGHTHNSLKVIRSGTSIGSENGIWSRIESNIDSDKFKVYEVYNDGGPTSYGEVLNVTGIGDHWQAQLWMAAGKGGRLYYRNKNYHEDTWGDWGTVAWTSDIPTSLPANGGNADTVDNYHASDFVRAYPTYGTSYSIDSDWGQSIVTFDPVVGGTYPISTPNSTILNLGNDFIRRKQLFFDYSSDNIYFRRHYNSSWTNWVRIALASDIPTSLPANGGNADYAMSAGSASSASKWVTARTITLTGSVTGSVSIDGSGDVTLATTTNHTHPYLSLSGGTITGDLSLNQYLKINALSGYGSGSADLWYNGNTNTLKWQNTKHMLLGSNTVLHSSNYNSYSPTLTGDGASGTWKINITGKSGLVIVNSTSLNVNYNLLFHDYDAIYRSIGVSVTVNPYTGNITAGHFYANSDVRYKNITDLYYSLSSQIALLPIFKYTWINREDSNQHIGSSALSVMGIMPELVTYDDKTDFYSLDYATLGAVAGISACKEVEMLKLKIKELELEIIILKSKYNG